ncbi:MAG: hypothetical protein RIC55_09020 [Pirellulaceae bacterium]
MNEQELSQEEAVEAIYRYAAEQMAAGHSNASVKADLMQQGLDPQSAEVVVDELSRVRSDAVRSAGLRNMGIGALWCIGGIAVTAITFSMASEGGGSYIVTWGAILFGGIQFLRGLWQTASGT